MFECLDVWMVVGWSLCDCVGWSERQTEERKRKMKKRNKGGSEEGMRKGLKGCCNWTCWCIL
jgi:hypothetical protein